MAYKLQETAPKEEEPTIPIPSQDVVSSGGPSAQALTKPLTDLSRVQEDPVDAFWRGKDGKIARARDATMCRHGAKGMCDYCMPLEVSLGLIRFEAGVLMLGSPTTRRIKRRIKSNIFPSMHICVNSNPPIQLPPPRPYHHSHPSTTASPSPAHRAHILPGPPESARNVNRPRSRSNPSPSEWSTTSNSLPRR